MWLQSLALYSKLVTYISNLNAAQERDSNC